jgi:hypothetical protein
VVFAGAHTVKAASGQQATVAGWTVRLVGMDPKGHRALVQTYANIFDLTVSPADLAAFAGYPEVVAVITQDDPTEAMDGYAPYALTVNDLVQPGG